MTRNGTQQQEFFLTTSIREDHTAVLGCIVAPHVTEQQGVNETQLDGMWKHLGLETQVPNKNQGLF